MAAPQYDTLAFLAERGRDATRPLSASEHALLGQIHESLKQVEAVVVRLDGRAGRLGESIVATALLEGILQALRVMGRSDIPITLIVDEGVSELFEASCYQDAYWQTIAIVAAPTASLLDANELFALSAPQRPTVLLDLHGAHDAMPFLDRRDGTLALMNLTRVGMRYYARHGALRRYADFIEDLFGLARATLDGEQCQPTIRLAAAEYARYPELLGAFGMSGVSDVVHIVCFFQSVVLAKCYGRWHEVLQHLCEMVAVRWPDRRLEFLVACGPDAVQPAGFRRAELAADYADFTGAAGNARVVVAQTPSLRDLALLLTRAQLALSNDSGPGHLAGALHIPTVVPFLPGTAYSQEVWASTRWHHGVSLNPNPFTNQQVEAAIIGDSTDIINSIDPSRLASEAISCLMQNLA